MVSQSTETLVNSVLDAQIDFNIKLIIFATLIFYAFLFAFINKRITVDNFGKAIYLLFSKVYIYVTVFFLPLFSIMMFRDYEAINLWTLLIQLYSGVIVVTLFGVFVAGWQKILGLFGIETDLGMLSREKLRDGEKAE
jgi:hypothetical protein